jgi:PAS domain S-box-containing protein
MTRSHSIPDLFLNSQRYYYTVINTSGRYIAANRYFQQQFQLTDERFEQINFHETVDAADFTFLEQTAEWCMKNPGKPRKINLRKRNQAGGELYTSWELTFCEQPANGDQVFQCIGYDVSADSSNNTEHVDVPRQIEFNNETFEALLANSIDAILITNENGIVTYCSPVIKEVMGYEPAEVIGKVGFSFVHPDDVAKAKETFELEIMKPGIQSSVDLQFRRKDGTWMWMEAKGRNLFYDPNIKGMLINLNDVSERKAAEEVLAESENRYRSFFNNFSQPILVVSKYKTRIVDANYPALQKYGYTIDEIKQMSLYDLFAGTVSPVELQRNLQNGNISTHYTKSGEQLYVQLKKFEVHFKEKDFLLLTVEDQTETYKSNNQKLLIQSIDTHLKSDKLFSDKLRVIMEELRNYSGFDLAEFWLMNHAGSNLNYEVASYSENDAVSKAFVHATTELLKLQPKGHNVSEKYTQYLRQQPDWIDDINETAILIRKEEAMKAGYKTALLFPVIANNKLVCYFNFYSNKKIAKDEHLVQLLSGIGYTLVNDIEKTRKDLMLDRFFEITSDIITVAGADGKYIRVNPAFEKFTGYSKEEIPHIHPLSYVHNDDKAAVLEQLNKLGRGERVQYFENRVITKSGETKWISWSATTIPEEAIVIATHRDITLQKESEEKIKIANERFELLKLAANEAIWEIDLLTKQVVRSNGYKNLFGYEFNNADEDLDFWASKIHPDERDSVINALNNCFQNTEIPQWQCEYRFQRIDGTYAHVWDKGYIIYDANSKPIRMVGSMQDITRQKEFAEQLKISNERYELVTNATNEAIWDLDLNNHSITWTKGYQKLFGHGFEENETSLDFWIANIHPDEVDKITDEFNSFIQQAETPFWEAEYRFKKKNGEYAYVIDKGFMIFDEHKNPVRVVGAMADHSERKKLEQELRIKERTRQNSIAQAAIDAQERERAEIGNELHDNVSQLLTTTKLYLEMLKMKQGNAEELLASGTTHINNVINEVRNLSRSLVPASITDLGLTISVADLIDSIKTVSNLSFEFEAVPELETLHNQNSKLTIYRIIQEQFNNIIKHAKAKNVKVIITTENNFTHITVTDDGCGFLINTIKQGHGLKNMKSRAQLMNGKAEIFSEPGKGCTLTVAIPNIY